MLKLFFLYQNDNPGYMSCVVVAETGEEACRMHPNQEIAWDGKNWCNILSGEKYEKNDWANSPETVKARIIGAAHQSLFLGEVICVSFRAD